MSTNKSAVPSMERITRHLLEARTLAARLNLGTLAYILDMAVLDFYGAGDEPNEKRNKGETPISGGS